MRPLSKGVKLWLSLSAAIVVLLLFYRCPIRLLFGVPCPSCGMTRALLAACTGDFEKAFAYHPLVPFFLPVGLYVWLSAFHGMRVPARQGAAYLLFLFAVFILVYICRLHDPTCVTLLLGA